MAPFAASNPASPPSRARAKAQGIAFGASRPRARLPSAIRGKSFGLRATIGSASTSTTTSTSSETATTSSTRDPREWPWPLPPTNSRPTRLERYESRLWGLTQPFYPAPFSKFSAENRMTVYALPPREEAGETIIDLWLHNPLPPTDELLSHLQSIKETIVAEAAPTKATARVAHLVVPSSSPEHWASAADALERLGDSSTSLWVPPNFFDGGRLLGSVIKAGRDEIEALRPRASFLERGDALEGFSGDVSVSGVVGGGLGLFTEFAFHLRSAKAVVTADSAFCLSDADAAEASRLGVAGPLDLFLARLVGIVGKLGSPPPVAAAIASAPGGQGKRFAEDVARWCDEGGVERVVSCHFSAPVEEDAAGQLRRVFRFLL